MASPASQELKKHRRRESPARQELKPNSKLPQLNWPKPDTPQATSTPTPGRSQGAKPIPSFGRSVFSLPRKRRRYNDDVHLGSYKPDVLHFAGGQRKGIREPLDECRDYEHHVREASKQRFPLSHVAPLPAETRDASVCIRDTPLIRSSDCGIPSCLPWMA